MDLFHPSELIKVHSPNFYPAGYNALTKARAAGLYLPRLIVLHTTQGHEREGSARGVSRNWFALKESQVSCTYAVDPIEVVEVVPPELVAWHAEALNGESIGIEICAKSEQTGPGRDDLTAVGEWFDDDSFRTLARLARLLGWIMHTWRIDCRMATDEDIRLIDKGATHLSGVCGHVDVNRAMGKGSHWDPGPSFPWQQVMLGARGWLDLHQLAEQNA